MNNKWTKEDRTELIRLSKKRQTFIESLTKSLRNAHVGQCTLSAGEQEKLAWSLVSNADEICAALSPFKNTP